MTKRIIATILACILIAGCLTGCTEAENAEIDIKNEADNFTVVRELTIVNTRTDTIQCKLTGTFSLKMDSTDHQLEIISKIDEDKYRRDLFHINDDTNYYVHNVDPEFEPEWKNYKFEIHTYTDLHPETSVTDK